LKNDSDIQFISNVIDLEELGEVPIADSHFLLFNIQRDDAEHTADIRPEKFKNLDLTEYSKYLNITFN